MMTSTTINSISVKPRCSAVVRVRRHCVSVVRRRFQRAGRFTRTGDGVSGMMVQKSWQRVDLGALVVLIKRAMNSLDDNLPS